MRIARRFCSRHCWKGSGCRRSRRCISGSRWWWQGQLRCRRCVGMQRSTGITSQTAMKQNRRSSMQWGAHTAQLATDRPHCGSTGAKRPSFTWAPVHTASAECPPDISPAHRLRERGTQQNKPSRLDTKLFAYRLQYSAYRRIQASF